MSVMLVDCSNCRTQLNLSPGAKSIRCPLCQAVTPVVAAAESTQPSPFSAGSPFSFSAWYPMLLHKAERKYEVGKVSDAEQAKQRHVRSILNKLTPHNFVKLLHQVKQVKMDNADTLSGLVGQIHDRAVMEPAFVEVYANFCSRLALELPGSGSDYGKVTFKRLLLNKCQEGFERGEREANRSDEEGEIEQTEEQRGKARRRMLGNIIFIGELYKKEMLTERIMHECIKKLLGSNQNNVSPEEEDIEALFKLMCTIGVMIDHPKAKEHMDAYFDKIFQLSNNMLLSSRVRFMLKDAIDLRKNKWQQRRKELGLWT